MKSIGFSLAVICIFFLIQNPARTDTNATSSPPDTKSASKGEDPNDLWIKHGEFSIAQYINGGMLFHICFYKSPSGQLVMLQDNLGGINDLFRNELIDRVAVNKFMHKQLANFLLSAMGLNDWRFINKEYAKSGWAEQYRLKLDSYITDTEPVLVGNKWTLNLNVLTKRGGVEHWLVMGSVSPFQISSFKRETLEADGTFGEIETTN